MRFRSVGLAEDDSYPFRLPRPNSAMRSGSTLLSACISGFGLNNWTQTDPVPRSAPPIWG